MPLTTTSATEPSFDFALLQQSTPHHASRNRIALLWLFGLLGLLIGAVVLLVLYLHGFEAEEDQRQRAADAQWLEQSAQFNFRRLEDDLIVLARQSVLGDVSASQSTVQGGLLWLGVFGYLQVLLRQSRSADGAAAAARIPLLSRVMLVLGVSVVIFAVLAFH